MPDEILSIGISQKPGLEDVSISPKTALDGLTP
jgi:hypothetical protein